MIDIDIVWTNGTFDILHPGHIELFKVARSLGNKVIVATDTDEKIRKDKGEHTTAGVSGKRDQDPIRRGLPFNSPRPRQGASCPRAG